MTGTDTWLGVFLFGLFLPTGAVASNIFVIGGVIISCIIVQSRLAYLVAPVVGTVVFLVLKSDMFFFGILPGTAVVQWLIATFLAALILTFLVRALAAFLRIRRVRT